jgi:hypothetical protein
MLEIRLNFELWRFHRAICLMECDADVYSCTGVLAFRKILLYHRTTFFLIFGATAQLGSRPSHG